jgi:hypothetical protein
MVAHRPNFISPLMHCTDCNGILREDFKMGSGCLKFMLNLSLFEYV